MRTRRKVRGCKHRPSQQPVLKTPGARPREMESEGYIRRIGKSTIPQEEKAQPRKRESHKPVRGKVRKPRKDGIAWTELHAAR